MVHTPNTMSRGTEEMWDLSCWFIIRKTAEGDPHFLLGVGQRVYSSLLLISEFFLILVISTVRNFVVLFSLV